MRPGSRPRPADASDFAAARRTGDAADRSWPPPCDQAGSARPIAAATWIRKRVVFARFRGAQQAFEPPPIDREITIAEGITVKELSEKLGVKANLVIKRLVEKKIFATINQTLDVKLAEELARDFGASTNKVSYEEETTHEIEQTEVEEDREKRASRGHHHGPRRSRQDVAAGCHSARPTWPSMKPAASRSTSARITSRRTAARSSSSTRRVTKRSPACAPAAPRSPTSWCWWWRPTTA